MRGLRGWVSTVMSAPHDDDEHGYFVDPNSTFPCHDIRIHRLLMAIVPLLSRKRALLSVLIAPETIVANCFQVVGVRTSFLYALLHYLFETNALPCESIILTCCKPWRPKSTRWHFPCQTNHMMPAYSRTRPRNTEVLPCGAGTRVWVRIDSCDKSTS